MWRRRHGRVGGGESCGSAALDAQFDDPIEDVRRDGDLDAVGCFDFGAAFADFELVDGAFDDEDATLLLPVGEVVVSRAEVVISAGLSYLGNGSGF